MRKEIPMSKSITDFINGEVYYDPYGGQYFWIKQPNGGVQMLIEMRGWGAIQQMFKNEKEAAEYQDKVAKFISDAINEKIQREKGDTNA
jgi:hypothetical protein